MTAPSLFSSTTVVSPGWIDYNGHMNMGYYLVAFDEIATDAYFNYLGIREAHKQSENNSTFTLASNIDYIQEITAVPLTFI